MRKIILSGLITAVAFGAALPGFAQEAMSSSSPTPSPTVSPSPEVTPTPIVSPTPTPSPAGKPGKAKAFDAACLQAAIEKRETQIIAALDKYAAAAKAALETRRAALKEAWGKATPKERRTAVRTAWAAYRKAITAARHNFRKDRQAAWKQYKTESKACRPVTADSAMEAGGEGADQSL